MKSPAISLSASPVGKIHTGEEVVQYRFGNANGMEVAAINFGGIITSLKVPDHNGKVEDVVLGFESLENYFSDQHFIGALIGRYCNRIANGEMVIDGETYKLAANNGPNHLHGGVNGFNKVVWQGEPVENEHGCGVKFTYLSKDMEEGYPGNLKIEATYLLTAENALEIQYKAVTDRTTVVNMTQHSYFNLDGHTALDILDHELELNADGFLPTDESNIPLGHIEDVADTPFDFRSAMKIGARINDHHLQLRHGSGYDHCFVVNKDNKALPRAAKLWGPRSGRCMEVFTSEPGIQFYAGNFLDDTIVGKGSTTYGKWRGLCLETGHFPDSPNQPNFPTTVLKPDGVYESTTIYKFSS